MKLRVDLVDDGFFGNRDQIDSASSMLRPGGPCPGLTFAGYAGDIVNDFYREKGIRLGSTRASAGPLLSRT